MATLVAEYRSEETLLQAARRMRALGHQEVDVFSPFPIHGAEEALGLRRSRVPRICLVGGLAGAVTAYLMQFWMVGVDFPINVGNRPPHSPPAFVPITFELAVLFASVAVFFGLMLLFGFPRLYHPVFEVEGFRTAAIDALWLGVVVPEGQIEKISAELRALGAAQLSVVPSVPEPAERAS